MCAVIFQEGFLANPKGPASLPIKFMRGLTDHRPPGPSCWLLLCSLGD